MFQPVRQVSVNFADKRKTIQTKTFNILYFMKTNLVNLALGLVLYRRRCFLSVNKKMTWFSNIREIR